MKRSNVLVLASITILSVFLFSCGAFNKMKDRAGEIKYTVTPSPLEMHAGEVTINISGSFPDKYFDKSTVVEIIPTIKYEGGEKELKPLMLQGEKVEENNKVIKFETGGSFTYEDKVEYTDEMFRSELMVKIKATRKGKELIFDPMKIADGIIATPNLVQQDSKVILAKDKFVRVTNETKAAEILFNIQQANLKPSELRDEDIKVLKDFIDQAKEDERREFKGVNLEAYASPDGAVDLNQKLSERRVKATDNYLKRFFRKVEEAEKEEFVKSNAKGQDWNGFKNALQNSDVADKELILKVLNMYSDPDVRNKEMKNLTKTFEEVAEEVLPKLRRSTFTVSVDVIGKSDEELKTYFDSIPDSLAIEEILYTAGLYEDNATKLKVYKKAAQVYPNDWRTHNNVGVIEFEEGNLDKAKTAFEEAKKVKANATVFNNLGAIAIKEGNFDEASELLTSASGAGKELDYNLGILSIRKAEYKEAASYFSGFNTANAGLSKILTTDVDGAIKTLEAADVTAVGLYLKAICGARKSDGELTFNSLRSAVGKDANLKQRAAKDVEFANYFEDDTFKSIIK